MHRYLSSLVFACVLAVCLTEPLDSTFLPKTDPAQQRSHDIVSMQKEIYSVLGQYEVQEIVSRFLPEFKRLDTDGTLASTLDSLYEMRLLEMQISIQHAEKMRSVLDWIDRLDRPRLTRVFVTPNL